MAKRKTYSDKLKDPRWQKKRLEIFERDNWMCRGCGATDKTLHVHHLKYTTGKDPWEYDNKELTAVCEVCHDWITNARNNGITLLLDSNDDIENAIMLIILEQWNDPNKLFTDVVNDIGNDKRYSITLNINPIVGK